MAAQTFGLTRDTSTSEGVDGKTLRFTMSETGTFAALSADDLDFSAWDNLTDEDMQRIASDVRTGGFRGFYPKGAQS